VISLSIVASRSRAQPHRVGRSQLRVEQGPHVHCRPWTHDHNSRNREMDRADERNHNWVCEGSPVLNGRPTPVSTSTPRRPSHHTLARTRGSTASDGYIVRLDQSPKSRTRSYLAVNTPSQLGAFRIFAPLESRHCATLMRPPRHAISSAVLPPPLVFGDTPLSTRAFASASLPSTAAIIRKFWPWSPGPAIRTVAAIQAL